jgi:hypothetical protein
VNGTGKCSLDSCPDPAVTRFIQRELCLQHFLSQCYEDLDRLDARARSSQLDHSGAATLKIFVEECSRCALDVSLRCEHLDNLQRARLLDILLWAGELLPKTCADTYSTGESSCSQGAKRGPFIKVSQGSVGRAIVESGVALLKTAAR